MTISWLRRFRHALIAIAALALTAGIAFGAQPDAASWGLSNAASHADKTVPVLSEDEDTEVDEDTETDEETDEDVETDEDAQETSEDAGDHCSTDPTVLTPDQLAEMNHGSVVCWAAHQTEWPEWFANHGAFVKCWAHQGKPDAPSCTEAPAPDAAAASHGKGHGKGKNKDR